ncbi:hypothetical protein J7413_03750 [Shimia sp. R10_1]|uniref:hypothetical protein n=1 Tax=Shimia sp. R10_1 TaxID=2821095 RepID=UPI001ADB8CB6|nr:hypothetical protein [Shimia sp. R10_1]MBO9472643.1 hypothetical protein [Shimia sp. R10_1]
MAALSLSACSSSLTGSTSATELEIQSSVGVSGKAVGAFDEFKQRNRAYGAFYVTRSGKGGWGSSDNAYTVEDAKAVGEAFCKAHNEGRPCRLYATLSPKNPEATRGMSPTMYKRVTEVERETTNGNWGAIFATPNKQSGWSTNYQSKKDAEDSARRECEEVASEAFKEATPVQKRVHEMVGLYDCKLIGFYR